MILYEREINLERITKIYGAEAANILLARMKVIRADRLYGFLRPTDLSTTTCDYIDGYVSTDIAVMLMPVNLWTRNTTLADIITYASRGKYTVGVIDTILDILPQPIAEEIVGCIAGKTFPRAFFTIEIRGGRIKEQWSQLIPQLTSPITSPLSRPPTASFMFKATLSLAAW